MGTTGTSSNSFINIVYDDTARGAAALPLPTDTFPAFLQPKVEICFSRRPLTDEHIHLYIVPADTLPSYRSCGAVPVIAYGPGNLLPLAFDCGCCDYLRSPWTLDELKVRALRALPPRQVEFEWGTVRLEGDSLLLAGGTAALSINLPAGLTLSPSEAAILQLLMLQTGNSVSREYLQAGLRRVSLPASLSDPESGSRALDVHISTLRKKFNLLAGERLQPHPIRSIYGYGYVLIHTKSTPYSCCG